MTNTATTGQRRNLVMAALTGLLILLDAALAAIGGTVWNAHRNGHLHATESATFTVVAGSAAVGVVVLVLALVALTRGVRGARIAAIAMMLAWLRSAGVVVALGSVVLVLGVSAIVGALQTFGAVVAVADAMFGLVVAAAGVRRTRE